MISTWNKFAATSFILYQTYFFFLKIFFPLSHLVNRSLDHSVTRSLGHLVTQSLSHSVTWSLTLRDHLFEIASLENDVTIWDRPTDRQSDGVQELLELLFATKN